MLGKSRPSETKSGACRMVGRKCEGAFLTVGSGKSDCESTLAGAEEDTLPD